MEYKNRFYAKNLILILLSLAIFCLFCGCNEQGSESSSSEFTESEVVNEEFDLETAKKLLAQDELLTEIFINNSLCASPSGNATLKPLTSGHEYESFSSIEALLNSTYTEKSKSIEAFLSYPEGKVSSVSSIEGRTYVFNHLGSSYNDFVIESTVEIKNGQTETEMLISAKTRTMNEITFKAVLEDGKWLLESGIFQLNPPVEAECKDKFPLSSLGSFAECNGRIKVIELFVSDMQSGFTSAEEDEYHARIKEVFDFIKSEADSYGTEVEFVYERARFDHGAVMGNRLLDFDIVFAETGFGTLKKFAEETIDLDGYDGYVFMVCMDKETEPDFSVYEGSKETEHYYGERALVGQTTDKISMCRSVLSLLGAYGYDKGLCSEYTESLFRNYFPNDIFQNGTGEPKITQVTAYACGMTDKIDLLHRIFIYE